MALPSGKYKAVMLWITQRKSQVGWDCEFVLVDTGEREKAFLLNTDAGMIAGKCDMVFREGRFQSRDPEAEKPVISLQLAYSLKHENTYVVSVEPTGTKRAVDVKYLGRLFSSEDF